MGRGSGGGGGGEGGVGVQNFEKIIEAGGSSRFSCKNGRIEELNHIRRGLSIKGEG